MSAQAIPPEQVFFMWKLKWFKAKPDLERLFRDRPELRDEFLLRKEVADLSKMRRDTVRQAIKVGHLLADILKEAQRLEAEAKNATPANPGVSGRTSSKPKPRKPKPRKPKPPSSGRTSSKPKPRKPKPPSSGRTSSKPKPKSRPGKSSPSNNDPYRSDYFGHRPKGRPDWHGGEKCPWCNGPLGSCPCK